MKAILVKQPGPAENMVYGDAPDPTPKADELLVRVRATAVNRADILQRLGMYPPPPGAPDILGLEIAGEVVQPAGRWRTGDRVMAVVPGGGYAELATVPAAQAMPIPKDFSYEQAAAIPEAFQTAYLNLFVLGRLQPGEIALIHAGASGVGSAAIQLARAAGARVFATAGSQEKLELCRNLGAELAINYKQEKFSERVLAATDGRGVDVILDFVGAPYWNDNLAAAARFARLMLIGFLGKTRGELDLAPLLQKAMTVAATTLRRLPAPQKEALIEALSQFALARFERGELKPVIDCVLPIERAADAHRHMEANRNLGKIVLRMS
ncbi:MAG TPA: NAD(P)H-quinone oxidoreductase [Burkholderiales bacterium]